MRCFYKDETMMAGSFGGGPCEIITPADACGAGGDWCGVCVPTFFRAAREKTLKRLPMEEITRVVDTNGASPVYLLQREGKKSSLPWRQPGRPQRRLLGEKLEHDRQFDCLCPAPAPAAAF